MSAQEEDSEGKRIGPWNSLEMAKLSMGLATPVALFLLGMSVTWQTRQADEERETRLRREAGVTEAQRKVRELHRDDQIRAEAVARENAMRELAYEREKAFRAESFARDMQMRQSADVRDASIRREGAELARYSSLLAKRIELWDTIGPAVSAMRLQVARTTMGVPYDREAVRRSIAQIQDFSSIYSAYFSTRFWLGEGALRRRIMRFETVYDSYVASGNVDERGLPRIEREGPLRTAWDEVHTAYGQFLAVARRELVVLESRDRSDRRMPDPSLASLGSRS